MLKFRNKKITLVIPLILALVISTSFCLEFLTMSALAAGFANPESGSNPVIMAVNTEMSDVCTQGISRSQSNGTAKEFIKQDAGHGIKDCCLNNDHHPTTAASSDNSLNQTVAITPLTLATGDITTGSFGISYIPIFSPPPEANALRSIVKNE